MATYTKPLKEIEIGLMMGGDALTVTDTVEAPIASQALAQFLNGQTMAINMEEGTAYIPFHSVAFIMVTSAASEEISRDPYGCDDEESSDGEDVNP